MISLPILFTASAVIIIPGIATWISLRERVVRLEERVKMHEENHKEHRILLEKIVDELKEIRDKLPR